MPRKRTFETEKQRHERLNHKARQAADDLAAADDVLDARVKRSIALYGP